MGERGVNLNTYKVEFVQENRIIQADKGTTVLQAQRMAGLSPDAPCGGSGKCGKCLVKVKSNVENAWRTVNACQTEIHCDLKVFTLSRENSHKILVKGTKREVELKPSLKAMDIIIPRCKMGESTSDWERLCMAVQEACKNQEVESIKFRPVLPLLPKIATLVKEEEGRAEIILSGDHILDVRKGEGRPVLMAAFDIGTTSVAGYLLDAVTGQQLSAASGLNPQTEYGADVIMRANYALERGVQELSISVRVLIKNMLKDLCEKADKETEDIYQVSVVGNTCMHHLFLGISPASLVLAPYNPAISQTLILPAADFRLGVNPGAELAALPVIAGFVGADTVGCMLAVNMEEEEKMTLMIDIGTNGEIVLGNRHRSIACSTAAGPAFEGAKIACGMRGAEGAVEHVTMENGVMECSVIGGGEAAGICGSGLIDLIARLLEAGIIDDSGKLLESPKTMEVDGKPAYILFHESESRNGKPVYLSQKDIREVQLAKGAIAAGIYLLAEKMEISVEDIEQVYIAGAFGNYMNPDSACRIGLIPPVLKNRIVPVGNAAGEGAKLSLLNKDEFSRAERMAVNTEFLELASMPEFQDQFVDELVFPEV